MSITRVHHVGLVAGDLEQARHVLCDGLGLCVDEHRTPWPQGRPGYDGTTLLEFPIGEMHYEVARPNKTESGAARFLASTNGRGGIYYVSLASDDIAADVHGLLERGVRLKEKWDGKGPVFLDPATCLGLGIQITPEEHYYVHPYFRGTGALTGMAHLGIAARDPGESRGFWGGVLGIREDTVARSGGQTWEERRVQDSADLNRGARPASDPVYILEYPIGGTVIEIGEYPLIARALSILLLYRTGHEWYNGGMGGSSKK
ncbi:MAG: hypothetical protein HW388_1166, partial [Dehalococcoidia bacterium]|nr:hypothetical protein [Dehalococcoidia bacterium]